MESMTEIVLYILLQKIFEPEAGGVFGWVLLYAALPWTEPFWRKCYLWDRPRGDSSRCLVPHAVAVFPSPDWILKGSFHSPVSAQEEQLPFTSASHVFVPPLEGTL